jgi:hypothetical protein
MLHVKIRSIDCLEGDYLFLLGTKYPVQLTYILKFIYYKKYCPNKVTILIHLGKVHLHIFLREKP